MTEIWDIYDENRNKTGKTILRSEHPRGENEYHLAVHIWIHNDEGQWLISKRTPNKHFPLLWECTGGSVLVGEDSLSAALREVREELGITIDSSKGSLYKSIKRSVYRDFCDVWVFNYNCSINEITLQENETCDAMWASADKIAKMIKAHTFIPLDNMQYVYDLLKISRS